LAAWLRFSQLAKMFAITYFGNANATAVIPTLLVLITFGAATLFRADAENIFMVIAQEKKDIPSIAHGKTYIIDVMLRPVATIKTMAAAA